MARRRGDGSRSTARVAVTRGAGHVVASAAGLVAGAVLDSLFADPRRLHPVAGFGRFAALVERRWYADSRAAGSRYAAVAVGVPVLGAAAAEYLVRRRPWLRAVLVAGTTWAVLGGASLRREAAAMGGALVGGDLTGARSRLRNLCGRDPSALDEKGLSRATVESVAENTSDAVVAPLIWGAFAGLPGLAGYRAVNTLDAMVGYRTARYERFGAPAARLDDAANFVPARLTAALTVLAAPFVGGSPARSAAAWWRDGARHPSPNAGRCEAAAAGALGVRLGGRSVYAGRAEYRPELGSGPPPAVDDIAWAARLSAAVGAGATLLAAGLAAAIGRARDARGRSVLDTRGPRTLGARGRRFGR